MSQINEHVRSLLTQLCSKGGVIAGDVALWFLLHDQADLPMVQLGMIEVIMPADSQLHDVHWRGSEQVNIVMWPVKAHASFDVIANSACALEHWRVLNPAHLMVRLLDLCALEQNPHNRQVLADAISAVAICLTESQRLLAFEAMDEKNRKQFTQLARQFEHANY